jgi:Flp pilus assembly protein protease CpaA
MNPHIIPNSLIAVLGMTFYGYAFLTGMPMDQIIWHSQVCAMALFAGFVVSMFVRGLGPGVLKLIAIGFLWFGVMGGLSFVTVSLLLTGVYGVIAQRFTGRDTVPYLPFAIVTFAILAALSAFESSVQSSVATEAAPISQ